MFSNPITYTLHVPDHMKDAHATWFGEAWFLTEAHKPLKMYYGSKIYDEPTRVSAEGDGEFLGFFFNLGNSFHCSFPGDNQPIRYFKRHQYNLVYMPDAACHYDFAPGRASAIWVHYPLYLFNLAANEYPFLKDLIDAIKGGEIHVVSPEAMIMRGDILRVIRSILYSNYSPSTRDTFFYYSLSDLMFKCFDQIDMLHRKPRGDDVDDELFRITKVKDYVHTHLAASLTLADLASEIGVAPRTLSRIFKKHYHETVMGFVLRSRMDKAKELLLSQRTMSVERIGMAVGYHIASHFTRAFVRTFGISPRQLRGKIDSSP